MTGHSPERDATMVALHAAGLSITRIAERVGLSYAGARRALIRTGTITPRRHLTSAERDAMAPGLARRYVAGAGLRALANETGLTVGVVRGILARAGTPIRAAGWAHQQDCRPKRND